MLVYFLRAPLRVSMLLSTWPQTGELLLGSRGPCLISRTDLVPPYGSSQKCPNKASVCTALLEGGSLGPCSAATKIGNNLWRLLWGPVLSSGTPHRTRWTHLTGLNIFIGVCIYTQHIIYTIYFLNHLRMLKAWQCSIHISSVSAKSKDKVTCQSQDMNIAVVL